MPIICGLSEFSILVDVDIYLMLISVPRITSQPSQAETTCLSQSSIFPVQLAIYTASHRNYYYEHLISPNAISYKAPCKLLYTHNSWTHVFPLKINLYKNLGRIFSHFH